MKPLFYFIVALPPVIGGGLAWMFGKSWWEILGYAVLVSVIAFIVFVVWLFTVYDWSH